ncbi:MAG: hypothetical protein IPK26_24705 [Planctomycetes bacterium]|nr:hypothetical protein [Planctomycetota bacterium]
MSAIFRLLGILLLACGAGLLAYGAATPKETFRAPFGLDIITQPGEAIAYGTGALVAGLLILLLMGGKKIESAGKAGSL